MYSICFNTLTDLDNVLQPLKFPQSSKECEMEADKFRVNRRSPLPGIVSALDGISIAIKQPCKIDVEDPRKYYNRNTLFALCVQAAVAAEYEFGFVSARNASITHDSTALHGCQLNSLLTSVLLPD